MFMITVMVSGKTHAQHIVHSQLIQHQCFLLIGFFFVFGTDH